MSIKETRPRRPAHADAPLERKNPGQIGPWKADETLTLSLSSQQIPAVVRVAATAKNLNLSRYEKETEYWNSKGIESFARLSPGDRLFMTIASSRYTDHELDVFFEGNVRAAVWAQTSPPWSAGSEYTPPGSATPHLFCSQDPDLPPGNNMGLTLLVRDTTPGNPTLVGASWHKTFKPKDGWNWQAPILGESIWSFVGRSTNTRQLSDWWRVVQTVPPA